VFIVPRPCRWESQPTLLGVISYFHAFNLKLEAEEGSVVYCLIFLSPAVQADLGWGGRESCHCA
jgi:hypothetical protein